MSAKASTSKARVFVAPDASAADEEIISPAEQRRIIEASGLLTGVRPSDLRHRTVRAGGHSRLALDDAELEADSAPDETGSEPSEVDWADDGPSDLDNLSPRQAELLASVLWIMPFLVLFSSLDLAAHKQYSMDLSLRSEFVRVLNILPGLALVIYGATRYAHSRLTIAAHFLLSAVGGSYMIHLVHTASYTTVLQRCPILGTLWIHSIVRLNLLPLLGSLAVVGAMAWTRGWTLEGGRR